MKLTIAIATFYMFVGFYVWCLCAISADADRRIGAKS